MFPISDVIPSRTTPFVTVGLIVLNALVFLYELQLPRAELQLFTFMYGVVPAHFDLVDRRHQHVPPRRVDAPARATCCTSGSSATTSRIGSATSGICVFYLACGAAAALGQTAISLDSTVPMIGASGAIAGVMGAYFVLYPHSRVLTVVFLLFFMDLVEIPAIFFLGIWFVKELFSGVGSLGYRLAERRRRVLGARVGLRGRRALGTCSGA